MIADIFNSNLFKSAENLDGNLNKMGRIACVKFANKLDAVAILTGDAKLSLPLNNGSNDAPFCYPSHALLEYIAKYDPAAQNAEIKGAGKIFKFLDFLC